jgi:hypothetical protein
MADEAFALSPISARAAQPSEADYDAIQEAFMETSRGRWFLGEYAKRNRNADTRMVLDAVARIEETMAAQRDQPPASDRLAEARLDEARLAEARLAEALATIRSAVDQAADAATAAFAGLGLQDNLAPIRKGTRIMKEISWRWREIGGDGRICDLMDSQIAAIEAGCGRIAEADASAALSDAFALIKCKIDEFGVGDGAAHNAADAAVTQPPAAPATEGAAAVAPEPAPAAAEAATKKSAEAADAHDEAVLDMVAVEMAEPDPTSDFSFEHAAEPHPTPTPVAEPPPVEPVVASVPEPRATPLPRVQPLFQTPRAPPQPSPPVAPEPSLGSTLIATGVLQRPKTASDPLAPIRRLSQAEKIALFS